MHKIIILGGVVLSFALLTAGCSGDDNNAATAQAATGGVAGASPIGGQATAGGGTTAAGGQGNAGGDTGGQGGAGGAGSGLAIVGTYVDNYGFNQVITASTWTMGMGDPPSVFHITVFSNADRYLVAQNDAANEYSPSLWSRFDWTEYEGSLYYCQTAYGAATEEAALATPAADATNPAAGGCSGFAWSILTPS